MDNDDIFAICIVLIIISVAISYNVIVDVLYLYGRMLKELLVGFVELISIEYFLGFVLMIVIVLLWLSNK